MFEGTNKSENRPTEPSKKTFDVSRTVSQYHQEMRQHHEKLRPKVDPTVPGSGQTEFKSISEDSTKSLEQKGNKGEHKERTFAKPETSTSQTDSGESGEIDREMMIALAREDFVKAHERFLQAGDQLKQAKFIYARISGSHKAETIRNYKVKREIYENEENEENLKDLRNAEMKFRESRDFYSSIRNIGEEKWQKLHNKVKANLEEAIEEYNSALDSAKRAQEKALKYMKPSDADENASDSESKKKLLLSELELSLEQRGKMEDFIKNHFEKGFPKQYGDKPLTADERIQFLLKMNPESAEEKGLIASFFQKAFSVNSILSHHNYTNSESKFEPTVYQDLGTKFNTYHDEFRSFIATGETSDLQKSVDAIGAIYTRLKGLTGARTRGKRKKN